MVVEEKMGIKEKPIPGENDHTVAMGVKAAKRAIDKAGIDPKEIDLIIYIGEEYKEYPVWTAGIKLQKEIGATNAWAFDTALRCGTTVMGLKIAKDMMLQDDSLNLVLLAGGYRNGDLINFENPNTRFMFNLGAGGGAIILKKGHDKNHVLTSHLLTDGAFSEDVIIPVGGTKNPLTEDASQGESMYFDVPDPAGMKARLEEKSMQNFILCIEKALEKGGLKKNDIDYAAILHMKRSAHDYVLKQLGLSKEQSIYLENYGHIGQFDQILSLELAEKEGKLKDGSIAVLVSAGIGYAWGATVIKWGK